MAPKTKPSWDSLPFNPVVVVPYFLQGTERNGTGTERNGTSGELGQIGTLGTERNGTGTELREPFPSVP